MTSIPPRRLLGHAAVERLPPPRQLHRRAAQLGRPAGRVRRLSTASSTCTPSPCRRTRRRCARTTRRTAAQYIAAGIDLDRSTLFVQSHVPAHTELAWILGTITGVRRGEPHDAVQGQVGQAGRRRHDRRPLHLSGADGRRHPALRHRARAGRRRPAAAPRAHPRPGRALQRALRRHLRRARGAHPQGVRPHLRPAGARRRRCRSRPPSEAGLVKLMDDPAITTKKIKSAVTDTEREIRYDPATQAGHLEPARRSTRRPPGESIADARGESTRGAGTATSRRSSPRSSSTGSRRSGARTLELLEDPAELDRLLAVGADRASERAEPTLREVYDRVGFVRRGLTCSR